jgi:hypothetical protein
MLAGEAFKTRGVVVLAFEGEAWVFDEGLLVGVLGLGRVRRGGRLGRASGNAWLSSTRPRSASGDFRGDLAKLCA